MAKEIIFGQLRLTVASLTIEQINQDRESFLESIRKNVEPELNKIGLYLINVNITDITDESDYIDSIGKKAAAEAINQAKVDVAEQEKHGAIGEAEASREKVHQGGRKRRRRPKRARRRPRRTSASSCSSRKPRPRPSARREADTREKEIKVAENLAEADKGKKARRGRPAHLRPAARRPTAIAGENKAKADIADADAELAIKQAEALQRGEVAKREAQVEIQKAQYRAETGAPQRRRGRAPGDREAQDRDRRRGRGREAPPRGQGRRPTPSCSSTRPRPRASGRCWTARPPATPNLVKSCDGDAKAAATLLMIEKIEDIVCPPGRGHQEPEDRQDHGLGQRDGGNGGSTTANFLSGLIKSLPPLHDIAGMAGLELPKYLGALPAADKKETVPSAGGKASPDAGSV